MPGPFDPIQDLRRVTLSFTRLQKRAFSTVGGTSETQCLILTELLPVRGMSVSEIAERIGSDRPWVSQVVEAMRKADLVEREPDPEDRRRVRIRLTATGRHQAMQLRTALNEQIERLLSELPVMHRATVLETLRRLASAFASLEAQV